VVKKLRTRNRTTTTETPETTRRSVAVRNRASYNSNRNSYRERNQPANDNSNEETRVMKTFSVLLLKSFKIIIFHLI
jgi:hypothetical protein